tara:strand:+ start:36 stop:1625 length:1590 start_codon:yes stop_codon:yes gene_type:complete
MDKIENLPNKKKRQHRMLLIYHVYRLVCIGIFVAAFWLVPDTEISVDFYFGALLLYLVLAAGFLFFWQRQTVPIHQQILISGTLDIVLVVYLIHLIGFVDTGLGLLLYVYVALLSILAPGQLAIFFAALASFTLLAISFLEYYYSNQQDLSMIFYTGVYGAGFFATALTAWYLSNWVRTNEKIAQRRGFELASLQKLNEYIVENLKYGVVYVDSRQRIKVINDSALRFFDKDDNQSPENLRDLSKELSEKYKKFIRRYQQTQNEFVGNASFDNLQIRFHAAKEGEDKTAVLIIINDIAEIAQQAQQMKLASLGFFSASIAHELRNPLGAISHACQLLGEDNTLQAEDARLKDLIKNNCERMNRIIKNVLQITRNQKSLPEKINLNEFLMTFRKNFLSVNQCKIAVKLPRKPAQILFDKSQLEQVLIILCENALLHGRNEKNGDVEISLTVERVKNNLSLKICDTGPGILPNDLKNVFDPFYTTQTTGNGMGLYLARDICQINHSLLEAIEQMLGACFMIHFSQKEEVLI